MLRPVQGLRRAERLVVTMALLSGFIAVARWIWNPNVARTLPAFFAGTPALNIGSATITWHQIITMIVAVAVAAALRLLLYGPGPARRCGRPWTTGPRPASPGPTRCGRTGWPGWAVWALAVAVAEMRRPWEPVGRDPAALAVLLGGLALAWALRLAHVISGWAFFGVALVLALAVPPLAAVKGERGGGREAPAEPEVPVEWWGVRRPWRAEDEEVLARGIAGG